MFLSTFLFFVSLGAQATPAAPPAVRSSDALSQAYLLFLEARELDDRDDAAGAIAAYRRALELYPDAAEVRAELAGVLVRNGQTESAMKEAGAAIALEPVNRTAHRLLGLIKAEMADRSNDQARAASLRAEAIADLEVVAEDRLVDSGTTLALGRLYVQAGRYAKGIETLRVFLLDRPDYADALLLLVTAYEQTDQWREAAAIWEQLADRRPRNTSYRTRQASALMNGGEFERAEQTLREIIRLQPANAEALNNLGYMFAERGMKLDEAVDLISRALAIEADNPSYLDSLGWAYVKQAKLDHARDPLQRAAAARPNTSVIQDHLAELYFRLKLYREAAAAWDRALAGDRAGVDVGEITRKRDRAKALANKEQ